MSRLYVIGDRQTGVLFIKTDPLKLTHISKATIESYAAAHGGTFDSVFAQIASGAKAIVNKTEINQSIPDVDSSYKAIGDLIGKGAVLSDAEFCFVAEIDDTDWSSKRGSIPPLSSVLSDLSPSTPADGQLHDGSLT